ncbi:MAG: FliI/YscN family ATPase [Phycisphaeraceae bacterium]|nr:MAG: FliI/YscN family ATPase [Phycisphaeraceae bacterium]
MTALARAAATLRTVQPARISGTVSAVRGLTVLVEDFPAPVGSLVRVGTDGAGAHGAGAGRAGEVVGFTGGCAVVMMLGQSSGIRPGERAVLERTSAAVAVSDDLLGRCVNGLGEPMDGRPAPRDVEYRPLTPEPVPAMSRRRVTRPMHTGLRALDLMATLGRGQRMGIFAGPGVGKSTLLSTIVKRCEADVCVVALIGERGREVRDFVDHALGPEGLARSVVVAATGDESPLMRLRASKAACSIAEHFRDRGKDVLLVMDSVTRFAHAQRQVGLSVGEPPATKGYTPSVFAQLALLLERAGAIDGPGGGSITGLYTILVEGDDMTEPVADAARGILDGHLVLSRALAHKSHYPAIDVLDSVSRVAPDVTDPEHQRARQRASRLLALYREVEDLVQIGAYAKGSSPEHDAAIEVQPAINAMLRQGQGESTPFAKARADLIALTTAAFDQIEKARPRR